MQTLKTSGNRTRRLKERMLSARPEICVERARYVTETFRQTEGEPRVIRLAKAFDFANRRADGDDLGIRNGANDLELHTWCLPPPGTGAIDSINTATASVAEHADVARAWLTCFSVDISKWLSGDTRNCCRISRRPFNGAGEKPVSSIVSRHPGAGL